MTTVHSCRIKKFPVFDKNIIQDSSEPYLLSLMNMEVLVSRSTVAVDYCMEIPRTSVFHTTCTLVKSYWKDTIKYSNQIPTGKRDGRGRVAYWDKGGPLLLAGLHDKKDTYNDPMSAYSQTCTSRMDTCRSPYEVRLRVKTNN